MLFVAFLLSMVLLLASGAPDPNVNVNIDININGNSESGNAGGLPLMDGEENADIEIDPEYVCNWPNFTIPAGTEYGCPCSYFGGTPTDQAMPGQQCCQPTTCPNSAFSVLHVCGINGDPFDHGYVESCRNSTDALDFAKEAWYYPEGIGIMDIDLQYVFSCQGNTYDNLFGICEMVDYVQAWWCPIQNGWVGNCYDVGLCKVESFASNGSYVPGSLICLEDILSKNW